MFAEYMVSMSIAINILDTAENDLSGRERAPRREGGCGGRDLLYHRDTEGTEILNPFSGSPLGLKAFLLQRINQSGKGSPALRPKFW
jgi:hypothetical protein